MLAVNFLILALGVLVTFLACFAMFIEEAFPCRVPLVRQEAAKTNASSDLLKRKAWRSTPRRNQAMPRRMALNRRVGVRNFSA
jgi:hypothetical protein